MLKIMIVDDDFLICEELQGILKDLEYEVAGIADSGETAVEMALDIKPDVILMDIVMDNGMDGIEAAEEILKSVDCVVIFVTGHGEEEIFERAKQVKPHGYILKPYTPMEGKSAIEIGFHKKQIENRLKMAYDGVLTDLKQRTSELETSNQQLEALMNATTDTILLVDLKGYVVAANGVTAERFNMKLNQFIGTCTYDLMPASLARNRKKIVEHIVKTRKPHRFQDTRKGIIFDSTVFPIVDDWGNVVQLAIYGKDITELKDSERALKKSEKDLRIKAKSLVEMNTALKILLNSKVEDQREFEEKILANIKHLVLPYLRKMRRHLTDNNIKPYLQILETNLNNIISPFSQKLSSKYMYLTTTEIEVANLVKEGRNSKDIAEMLGTSYKTIQNHRVNIRKKLKITKKPVNLRSFLSSLQ